MYREPYYYFFKDQGHAHNVGKGQLRTRYTGYILISQTMIAS